MFYLPDNIAKVKAFVKSEINICGKEISLTLLTELCNQDRNDRKARQRLKERLQIIFLELLFLSYNKNTPQIVTAIINNISCTDFIRSSKKKIFRFVVDELSADI